jgi:hypothetical protein
VWWGRGRVGGASVGAQHAVPDSKRLHSRESGNPRPPSPIPPAPHEKSGYRDTESRTTELDSQSKHAYVRNRRYRITRAEKASFG